MVGIHGTCFLNDCGLMKPVTDKAKDGKNSRGRGLGLVGAIAV